MKRNGKNNSGMNWKNGLVISAISYILYMALWLVLDNGTAPQAPEMTPLDYLTDFLLCMLFTYTSLGFCHIVFKVFPFKASFSMALIYASCLLLLNNMVAFGMICISGLLWGDTGNGLLDELLDMKGTYAFAMISSFISCVYANTFYLQSYLKAYDEKKELEIALMKEKEIALQSQLNALKLQINPHFMFNCFNSLMSLIEEDGKLAEKFLAELSKVYRHIISNLDRDLIPVSEEIKFLDSYLYLMKVRYADSILTRKSPDLEHCAGFVPPAVMQILVENAIKHNSFSPGKPLCIDISISGGNISVRNSKSPMVSEIDSTGIGLKNIMERYALLCGKDVLIDNAEDHYAVLLPIISKTASHEDIDS